MDDFLSCNSNFNWKSLFFLLVSVDVLVSGIEKISRSNILILIFLSLSTVFKFDCFEINEWKKVACVLYSEWHEKKKKSLTKWLYKKTMKHWKSSAKMDLTKKLPFSSTFLEVYLVLGKKQGKYLTNFSKLITETTESQSGNIWKDQWCLAEVVYIYAFSTIWVFPPFYHFFP